MITKMHRSKGDSEKISDLRVEIKLLKTFIMETHNNLTELRRAEQSTEAEARDEAVLQGGSRAEVSNPQRYNSSIRSNQPPATNLNETLEPKAQSPALSDRKSSEEDSDSGDGTDNDTSSVESKDRNDQDDARLKESTPGAQRSVLRFHLHVPDSRTHRESSTLLQMVPYRPRLPGPFHQDRLISNDIGPDNVPNPHTHSAISSVRLLLDKWTTSGSAPFSNILDEEATKEAKEESV